MGFEITPPPSDQERAAIEAALVEEIREEQASPWADGVLPGRSDRDEA
ncbi:MAG TPA: hypothetical protein VMU58_07655 [Gaiellaceae bacterium]|nr:hypothetical protein [Gaiellaceae bacterium]